MSSVTSGFGTNRTNRVDLMMSVARGNPEVAVRAVRTVFDPQRPSRCFGLGAKIENYAPDLAHILRTR
jgi:hypothetical protein